MSRLETPDGLNLVLRFGTGTGTISSIVNLAVRMCVCARVGLVRSASAATTGHIHVIIDRDQEIEKRFLACGPVRGIVFLLAASLSSGIASRFLEQMGVI